MRDIPDAGAEIAKAQLVANFRSHAPVLGLVNGFFGPRFANDIGYFDLEPFVPANGRFDAHALLVATRCDRADDTRQ